MGESGEIARIGMFIANVMEAWGESREIARISMFIAGAMDA